jgi:pimeloyl-ACP methyl ester carboxylesterase
MTLSSLERIPVGQADLAAQVAGNGDPVVFLHAAIGDRRMWQHQVDAVAATHRAIAYDRRGHGETRFQAEPHSPVADLMAVIDALGHGKPAILVGCSQGGRIALDAALQHPDRIRGLVLIDNSVSGAPEVAYPARIQALMDDAEAARQSGDVDTIAEQLARLWLDGVMGEKGRVGEPLRSLFLDMNRIILRAPPVGANLDTATAYDRLGLISTPTLVLCGELDFPHIMERCRHVAATMPNATMRVVHEAGHVPSLDQAVAVIRNLLDFLQRLPRVPTLPAL